jgi:hypothetical protein
MGVVVRDARRLSPVWPAITTERSTWAQAKPDNQAELIAKAGAHPRRRQNQPSVVKAFFREPEVRYAAC